MSERFVVLAMAVLIALAGVTPAVVAADQVTGSPDISLQAPANEVAPGTDVELPVYVSNEGRLQESGPDGLVARVTTARAVRLTARDSETPIEVNTGTYPVGNVPEGTSGPIPLSLTIPEDTPPGTYRIPVRVRYSYAPSVDYGSGTDGPEYRYVDRRETLAVSVIVRDRAQFAIVDVDSAARVSGDGPVSITVRNTGTAPARAATLRVHSSDDEVTFGSGADRSDAFAGTWAPGENRTFEFRATVAGDAVSRQYPLNGTVAFTGVAGVEHMSRPLNAGLQARPETSFSVGNLSAELHVDEPGTIRGEIRNEGPVAVDDAVVVCRSAGSVTATDRAASVGRLAPGESRSFTFDVDVGSAASAGDRQLNLSVRYRDPQGTRHRSDPLTPTVSVDPERDWLRLATQNATFGIDTDNRLAVRVENTEDVALSNLRARLETEPPFSTESRLAYVDQLDPGETETLAFGLTVSEDGVATRSSIAVTVTAERPDGERITVDTFVVPVSVAAEQRASDTTLLAIGALVAVVAMIGGWWWLRRR